jgi:two-component system phosphate regulon sensor histidine kinase PhoR
MNSQLKLLLKKKSLVWRGLLCFLISVVVFYSDTITRFDLRFDLRPEQKRSDEIVLINLKAKDFYDSKLWTQKDVTDLGDSHFWNEQVWTDLLTKLLASNPKKIGVLLHFDNDLINDQQNFRKLQSPDSIFLNPKIIWGSIYPMEMQNDPLFTNQDRTNIANIELLKDDDGFVRKIDSYSSSSLRNLTEVLVSEENNRAHSQEPKFINFRGEKSQYSEINLSEFLNPSYNPDLSNKYVLIGARLIPSAQVWTPIGNLDKTELFAQVLDNEINSDWIKKFHDFYYIVYIFFILILSLLVLTQYPQNVAFFIMLFLGIITTSLSLWIFDTYSLWTPIMAPLSIIVSIWIIFLGYHVSRIERKNFQLEQEQIYLQDLEQLKTNFVSLISHDLKTPIAKIQAVVGRMKIQYPEEKMQRDLSLLNESADELNKYIANILKLLRIESRNFSIQKTSGDINELILEVVNSLLPLSELKAITIKTDLEPLFSFEADFLLIREVIHNLIENAIKYSSIKSRINILSYEKNDYVHVEIHDQGEGIEEQELPLIWNKFVRGKNQDLKTKGHGLGLYLAKYFIELHGGTIFLRSEKNKGTSIHFQLPI